MLCKVEREIKSDLVSYHINRRYICNKLSIKPSTLSSYLNGWVQMPDAIREKINVIINERKVVANEIKTE